MKRTCVVVVLGILFASPVSVLPQDKDQESAVGRLRADIGFLASDALEGRGTPSRGLDIAAHYLEAELKKAGVAPALPEGYRQTYRVGSYSPNEAKVTVRIDGVEIDSAGYVFINIGYDPANGALQMPLVDAGTGVVDEDKKVDELGELEVTGKAVVVRRGAPWQLEKAAVFGADRAVGKLIAATVRGARLLIYLSPDMDSGDDAEAAFFHEMRNAAVGFVRPTIPNASALGPMLVLNPEFYRNGSQRIEVTIEAQVTEGTASNVLGKIDGTDARLRDEWVLLTAHYDHIGSHRLPPGQDGLWNGADDNASGTAGVLELARRFARHPGKRSVLVFFTSGEDRGLFGSAFYSAHPVVTTEKIALQLNMDMVGRSQGQVQAIVTGAPSLFDEAVASGKGRSLEVIPDQQPSWRVVYLTDCYHFARKGVPSLYFFTGLHADYHQPSDTADKIRYVELGHIVEVSEDLARSYADGKTKPEFARPVWFRTPTH